jgi:uncharacterized membrane protein YagU involved in acid resistance
MTYNKITVGSLYACGGFHVVRVGYGFVTCVIYVIMKEEWIKITLESRGSYKIEELFANFI